jgi:hypothetical protein
VTGGRPRRGAPEHGDHGTHDPARGLDANERTVVAAEQDAAAQVAWWDAVTELPGAVDGLTFDVFLDELLVLTLRPERMLFMDNLSVHARARWCERALKRGAVGCGCCQRTRQTSIPIELAFSKLKSYPHRAEARTQDALDAAIRAGLARITGDNAVGWFRYCGYDPTVQAL